MSLPRNILVEIVKERIDSDECSRAKSLGCDGCINKI